MLKKEVKVAGELLGCVVKGVATEMEKIRVHLRHVDSCLLETQQKGCIAVKNFNGFNTALRKERDELVTELATLRAAVQGEW